MLQLLQNKPGFGRGVTLYLPRDPCANPCFIPRAAPRVSSASPCPPSPPKELVSKPPVIFLLCPALPSKGSGGPGCSAGGDSTSGPQHLICLLPRSCFFLRTEQVLVTPADHVSRSLAGCSKRQREDKRNEIQPPLPWQTLVVCCSGNSPAHSLLGLCKSPVLLLAGGSTAPKISKFGARESAGDGSSLGQLVRMVSRG